MACNKFSIGEITSDMTYFITPSGDFTEEVDLSIFRAQEVRNILRSKAHCLRAGFPLDHMIISVFHEILDDYKERVGLATYLSQMLGDLANVPVQDCTFFDESERLIEVDLNGNGQRPVQRFVARQFERENLPFRVDIRRQADSSRIETRYL
jgi:hypothetical protein